MEDKLKRPVTLKEGTAYLWQENGDSQGDPSSQPVILVAYDACPAFVIVRDEGGKRWRCPREVLFTLKTRDQDGLSQLWPLPSLGHSGKVRESSFYGHPLCPTQSENDPPAEPYLPGAGVGTWRAAQASSKMSS